MKPAPRPRVFFSFRSPFSWMAIERLLRAAPDAMDEMTFIPFWEPDPATAEAMLQRGAVLHYAAMSKAKHLYILQDTKRLAKALGLPMQWPVDVRPWWEPSHLAWLKARRLGRAREFYAAVVAARWHRAENISEPDVVRAIAASVGLDGDALAGAVDDPEIRAEGVDCLVQAYEDDIFGVPFFRLRHERFWGVDRLPLFLDAIGCREDAALTASRLIAPLPEPALTASATDDALADVPAAVRERIGAYDVDATGGCG